MKCYLSLFIFLLIGIITVQLKAADSTTVAGEQGPGLVFKEDSYDFGNIEPGAIVEHVFYFQNVGQDTVFIREMNSG